RGGRARVPALPQLHAQAQGSVPELRAPARPGLADLPVLRGGGRTAARHPGPAPLGRALRLLAPGKEPHGPDSHPGQARRVRARPRRRAILEQLGADFEVVRANVEEIASGDPEAVARENASRKARAVARRGATVLGVDTVVALDGRILDKPADPEQAREWLQ